MDFNDSFTVLTWNQLSKSRKNRHSGLPHLNVQRLLLNTRIMLFADISKAFANIILRHGVLPIVGKHDVTHKTGST